MYINIFIIIPGSNWRQPAVPAEQIHVGGGVEEDQNAGPLYMAQKEHGSTAQSLILYILAGRRTCSESLHSNILQVHR